MLQEVLIAFQTEYDFQAPILIPTHATQV